MAVVVILLSVFLTTEAITTNYSVGASYGTMDEDVYLSWWVVPASLLLAIPDAMLCWWWPGRMVALS